MLQEQKLVAVFPGRHIDATAIGGPVSGRPRLAAAGAAAAVHVHLRPNVAASGSGADIANGEVAI